MENIYDAADTFAETLANAPECVRFKAAQAALKQNPEQFQWAQRYMQAQLAMQARQAMGQSLSNEEIADFNAKTMEIMAVPEIASFFQAQMAVMPIFQDIVQKISTAIGLDANLFGGLPGIH